MDYDEGTEEDYLFACVCVYMGGGVDVCTIMCTCMWVFNSMMNLSNKKEHYHQT